jgi:hypothetical protein
MSACASGLMYCNKFPYYSITSSAVASNISGNLKAESGSNLFSYILELYRDHKIVHAVGMATARSVGLLVSRSFIADAMVTIG